MPTAVRLWKRDAAGTSTIYYKKEGFSIYHAGLTEEELSKLNETIQVLSRFKGLPQFKWLEELSTRFKSSFMATPNCESIISFEDNRFAEGKQYISLLFESITQKQVLKISYQPFEQETPAEQEIHPYYLKEYNNRWFLFGLDSSLMKLSTLTLDRIKEVKKAGSVYIANTKWNFGEYFEDVIGVTVKEEKKAEPIKLWVDGEQYNYIKTKPLHGSQ